MPSLDSHFDFIVVGAGPAGCSLAARLANSVQKPSVLLIEAGNSTDHDPTYKSSEKRYALAFTNPEINWGYQTTPQHQLSGRPFPYARGKGLGGSSLINFSCWIVGSEEDYNQWAMEVKDPVWEWENVQRRFRKIEKVQKDIPEDQQNYIETKTKHGHDGVLDLTWAKVWDDDIELPALTAAEQLGIYKNRDINSGNPIGIGLPPSTWMRGERVNAYGAYLSQHPPNLTVLTGKTVATVLFTGKTATAIRTTTSEQFTASNEIILSGGSVNTAQLLLLSGIGPAEELAKHNIPIINNLPGVGKHLIDHSLIAVSHLLNQEDRSEARQWPIPDPQSQSGGQVPVGYVRSEAVLKSSEFQNLPDETRKYLIKDVVPSFEFSTFPGLLNPGTYIPQPTDKFRSVIAFVTNAQSEGSVTLLSSRAEDPPILNCNILSHPYDQRVAIEGLRFILQVQATPTYTSRIDKVLNVPRGDTDADLLAFIRECGGTVYHMAGTAKMGSFAAAKTDPTICVTPDFRVNGVHRLRVVDMSVAPLIPSGHTMSTAYMIGETAAEKLVEEYNLDVSSTV